jgi:hypothetical protein
VPLYSNLIPFQNKEEKELLAYQEEVKIKTQKMLDLYKSYKRENGESGQKFCISLLQYITFIESVKT